MPKKRVVLLSNRSLLATSVQKLLQEEASVKFSIILADDPEVKAKIARCRPGVIILDSGDVSLGEGVITRLLEENPRTSVVALNLNHVGMQVYHMEHVLQTDLNGLLETIQCERSPAKPKRRQGLMNEISKSKEVDQTSI